MTILTIEVPDEQTEQIKKLLHDAHIVNIKEEKTAVDKPVEKPESALERIKKILEDAKGKELFKDIKDPSEWQRQIRKEWERDF
jgi:hypothetical protein